MKSKKIIALVLVASLINSTSNLGASVRATEKNINNINIPEEHLIELKDNIINVSGYNQNKVEFKVGFDIIEQEFTVYDQTANMLHKDFGDVKFWSIRICDSEGNEKKYIELKGTDYANSNKLDELKGFKYKLGDFVELWHKEHVKQSINGRILDGAYNYNKKSPENDVLLFKLTEDGLEAVPNNKNLDNTTIHIKGDWWKTYDEFIIHFNNKEKKLKLSNRGSWYSYKSIGYNKYCVLQIFRKNEGEVLKVELNGYDTGQSAKLNALHNFKYEYGDVIRIWNTDFEHQIIRGHVINATKDYRFYRDEGMNFDTFQSLGFEITKNGLKEIANEVPKLEGIEDVEVNVGEEINIQELQKKIKAIDDIDGDITQKIVKETECYVINEEDRKKFQNEFKINNTYPSTYKIKFMVMDSWGKESSKIMTIKVTSKLEKNKINVLGFNSEKKFDIGFDETTKKFKIQSQQDEPIHDYESIINRIYFTVKVLDVNNNEKAYVELNGGDYGTSEKLNILKDLNYEYGDILIFNHLEKGRFRIDGKVIDSKENYEDGVENDDNLYNTVFEITNDGLKAIYNEVPTLTGVEDIIIRKMTSEDILSFATAILAGGISATDEREGDITENIRLDYGELNLEIPGEYNTKYFVSDKWGRTTEKLRKITVIEPSKLEENFIRVDGFGNWGARDKFKIGFDDINKVIKIYDKKDVMIHETLGDRDYFKIQILNSNGIEKKSLTMKASDFVNGGKLAFIQGSSYEHGDLIKLWHAESSKLHIKGNVIDATKDYSNEITGVGRDDLILEITEGGLKETTIVAPTISGVEEIVIRKGQQLNLMEGVTANDEREGNVTERIAIGNNNLNINILGEYTVEYIVSNSLGKESRVNRKIKVVEIPKLEENKINVFGYYTTLFFTIGFDDLIKEFKLYNQNNNSIHIHYTPQTNDYFSIKILDKAMEEKLNINLIGTDTGNTDKLNKLKDFKFEYGDIIKLYHLEPSSRLKVEGQIIDAKEEYSDGIENRENIDNTVFQITESGLKAIYNEAPEINGAENIKVRKNSNFDLSKGITVIDDLDGDITSKLNVIGNIDTSNLGDYRILYEATDSLGRKTTTERVITVVEVPKLEANSIDLLGYLNSFKGWINKGEIIYEDKKLNLTFDDINHTFRVNASSSAKIYDEQPYSNKRYIEIKLLDKYGKEKVSEIFLGKDHTFLSNKLSKFFSVKYEYGDVLKIYHAQPEKLRIVGAIIDGKEDYADGINNINNVNDIENIGFEITENGLKYIYNNKPEIKGVKNVTIRQGEAFNKLEGITSIDDRDGDITSKINVTGDLDTNNLGEYKVYYTVEDSWGRQTKATAHIRVISKPKLENNFIQVTGQVVQNIGNNKFKMGFDDINKQLKIYDVINNTFHDYFSNKTYFKVKILDKHRKEKKYLDFVGTDNVNSNKLQELNGYRYEYGDRIKLWHAESDKLHINGEVIDAKIDYSQKIRFDTNAVEFEITENGLKAIYNEAPIITGIGNTIIKIGEAFDNLEGVIVKDDHDKNLVPEVRGTVDINTLGDYELTYLARDSWGAEQIVKRIITVRSNNKPNIIGTNKAIINVGEAFDIMMGVSASDVEDGDLTSSILVKGNVDNNLIGTYTLTYSVVDSDGNKSVTKRIIVVKSNEKPIITGTTNITIKEGDNFDPIFEVEARDTEDGDLTDSIKVQGELNTTFKGVYDLIYSVTDKDRNEAIATRRVIVRSNDKPVIEGVKNLAIKVGDIFDILSGITAKDTEDKDLTSKVLVTGELDVSKPGIYKLTYSVIDSDGNKTSKMRLVSVKTNNKPIIEGMNDITIKAGDDFEPRVDVRASDTEDGDITDQIIIDNKVDTSRPGEYEVIYTAMDLDNNITTAKRIVTVRSNDKPIIKGVKKLTLKVGDSFDSMDGVIATDTEDGDLTKNINIIGIVDTTIEGVNNLIYRVIDSDNNETTIKRNVTIRSNNRPTLFGIDDITIKLGETFDNMADITAYDEEDGDLTDAIKIEGAVDINSIGVYTLTYKVLDDDGNEISKNRSVTVRSNNNPEITGVPGVTIKVGDTFDLMNGVNAIDVEDGDITKNIKVAGTVNTNVIGKYELTYSITDKDENTKIVKRIVRVRSNEKPIITGVEDIEIKLGDAFNPLYKVKVHDAEDGDLIDNIDITNEVNVFKVGEYQVTYSVNDLDGNISTAIRKVKVRSNDKPIINGLDRVIIKVGDEFNPMNGVNSYDTEDGELFNFIKINNKVDTAKVGTYDVIYSVVDTDGNKTIATRKIKVRSNEKPRFEGIKNETIKVGDDFDTLFGVSAHDTEDGDISNVINVKGQVNNLQVGVYDLLYSVVDSDGNESVTTRRIIVRSNTKPILSGIDNLVIKKGDNFDKLLNVTATDVENGILTKSIIVKGEVDTNTPGIYDLIYSVTDSDNNKTTLTRNIIVRSNEKPELKGIAHTIIKIGEVFDSKEGVTAIDLEDNDITSNIVMEGNVNANVIGEYELVYSVRDSDNNEVSAIRKVTVRSNEKPVIVGTNDINVKINDVFNPLNEISAIDAEDNDLTTSIRVEGVVDTTKEGKYVLNYSVIDSDGNETTVARSVTVKTNNKPELIGVEDVVIKLDDDFDKLIGVEARDHEDGEINHLITIEGEVNTKTIGTYNLTYSVIDSDGNKVIVTRRVDVRSNDKPVILGVDNKIIKVGDIFDANEGVVVTDTEDKDLTNSIVIKGNVDVTKIGKYVLEYLAEDSDGNKTVKTRIITVRSNDVPIISGAEDSTIKVGDNFDVIEGVTVTDTEDGEITYLLDVEGDIDTLKVGEYNLVYSLTDEDGNELRKNRRITVRSNDKPVITGVNQLTIKVGDIFDKLKDVIASDNEDGDISSKILVEGDVDTSKVSAYSLFYSIVDSDGNKVRVKRRVIVRSNTKPVIDIDDITIKVGESLDYKEGLIVTDLEDGNLIDFVNVTGDLDNTKVGVYDLHYSVTDKDGNRTDTIRKVTVRTNDIPIIEGVDDITIKVGDKFDPNLGIVVRDTEDKYLINSLKIKGNVDTNNSGKYDLVYSVTDSDGNLVSKNRRIFVRTNEKPVIKGANDIQIKEGDAFNPLLKVTAIDKEDGDLTKSIKLLGGVEINKSGIYELTYSVKDSDENESIVKRQVEVRTNEQPIINGIEYVTIKIGETFNPREGVTATDIEDGDLTSDISINGNVDTGTEGIYSLTYLVRDNDNNETVVTRGVTVRTDTKPVIKGVKDITIKIGDVFHRSSGIIAIDKEDGTLTNLINIQGAVNTNVLGRYEITYSVKDSDGNITTVPRNVIVRSNNKPEMLGVNRIILKVGDSFNPLEGITARDSEDLDLTNEIIVNGNVDTNIADVYRVNYSVTDSDGNKVNLTRIVEVKTNEKPVLLNVENANIKVGDSFELISGEVALDAEDGDISSKIKCIGTIDVNTPSIYELTYSVIDSDGNEAVAKRLVTVRSNDSPVIFGADDLVIKVGDSFDSKDGVSAIDTEDGIINNLLNVSGKVDTSVTGVYKLTYSVTDSDGNTTTVIREVRVRSNDKPIIDGVDNMTIPLGYDFDKFISITARDKEDGDLTSLISVVGDVDVNKIGVYTLTYSLTDDDENTINIDRKITVRSNDKPIILGAKNITIKLGDNFDKVYGVTATDTEDKDLTNSLIVKGNVDTLNLGTYDLTYTITDSDNNTTTLIRKVIVRSNDEPVISGVVDKVIKIGDKFDQMLGIEIKDTEDGEITNRVVIDGAVDINTIGQYELIYSVIDDDGNKVSRTRKITVRSNDRPAIVGTNNITLKVGDIFNEMDGVIATDTEDSDITKLIQVKGTVDINKQGKYNLLYSVTDSDGNKSRANRTIIVRSNEKPRVIGVKDIIIKLGDLFNEKSGIVAIDKEDGDLTKNISIKGAVDVNVLGEYELIYSVIDKDANAIEVVRKVKVRSNESPKILGVKNEIIKVKKDIDLREGIKAIDKEDNDLTNSIKIIENFNNTIPGVYEIEYLVTDSDENTTTIKRLIIVESNDKPIISGVENITIKVGDNFDPMDGVTVIDTEDGELTNKNTYFEGNFDINKIGVYELKYYSQDSDGNKVSAARRITVKSNDKPVILNAQDKTIKIEEDFNPLEGVIVTDTEDLNVEKNLKLNGVIDNKVPGTYKLTYFVTDSDGNEVSLDRIITVETNDKPTITGNENVTIKVGDTFDYLADITALDTEDGNLSEKVYVKGEVNTKKEGVYTLYYGVIDSDKNETIVNKVVTVRSNDKPIIIGANNITVKAKSNFDFKEGVVVKDKEDGDITSKLNVLGNIDLNEIGRYVLTYSITDSDGNKVDLKRIVRVRSNDKPIITGVKDETIIVGTEFDALDGIEAEDIEDGDLTDLIKVTGAVDTNAIGEYQLEYSVVDEDGNETRVDKLVTVRSNEKPMILGADIITLKVADSFNPRENVIANDKEDGDLTNLINIVGNVDTNKVGNYDLIYSVKDNDGNSDIVKRRVIVRSNEKPILKGIEDITIKVGDDFDSLIYVEAIDKEEGDLSETITVEGEVNVNIVGEYELIYSVIDEDGNKTIAKRIITVRSNEKPTISGVNKVVIKAGDNFDAMLGVIANDKEDGDITNLIKVEGEINTLIPDEYKLIYSVVDSDGNVIDVARVIRVRSNEKPILKGIENITIKASDYFDAMDGIEAIDEEDGDISKVIEVTGELKIDVVGEYELTYSVSDDDGNISTAKRVITVRSNDVPIISGVNEIIIKQGDVFNPLLDVEVTDTEDGNLIDKLIVKGNVDTNNIGVYGVTYSVIDSDENETIVKRKVKVRSNQKPQITGVDNIVIGIGEAFDPKLEVVAIDMEDGNISNLISVTGIVDNRIQGNYSLVYSVKDSDGNLTSVTRTITVKGSDAPIIVGIEDTSIKLGEDFDFMSGVSAKTVDGEDVSGDIEVIGFVDTTKSGTYKLVYTVSDYNKNKIILTRNIIVENLEEPIVKGIETIIVDLNYKFDPMAGIEISNLKEGQSISSIEVLGTVDTSKEGDYNILYVITDNEGKVFTTSRIITVTSEDTLILSGAEDVTLRLGDEFNPRFGVILNNYKGEDLTEILKVMGTVNTNIPGVYRLIYHAIDKDGNTRYTTRDIKVVEKDMPIIYGINDLVLNFGDKFDPLLGVTATGINPNDLNGNIKVVGKVDTNIPGVYNLIYSVTNTLGKTITVNRVIEIKNQNGDLIKGIEDIILREGDIFDPMAGVEANYKNVSDATKLIKVIGTVDTSIPGKYKLVYSLSDKRGINAVVARVILVKGDKESLIQGVNDIEINVGDEFNPMMGVLAKDEHNNDLTKLIKVEGNVDFAKPGKYNLIYSVIDSEGVKTQIARSITITDSNSPKLMGAEDIVINNIEKFNPMDGIIVKDKNGLDITEKVKLKGVVDNKRGTYNLQYSVVDEEGNELSQNRNIIVKGHEKDNVVKEDGENESILYDENGKAKFKELVPHDEKKKPLSLIGVILIAIGNFIRRKRH